MGFMSEKNHQLLSKIATSNRHGEDCPYFDGWKAYNRNPFHLTKNPDGVIQMGLAENELSFDLIEEWIKENPRASICTKYGVPKFKDIALFQDYHGLSEFRNALAKFMGRTRGDRVTYDPDRIVMSGGATGANETLIFCLADPGDAFLVPSPYYPAFNRDLGWRTGVELVPVVCHSWNNFQITQEALEAAYQKAQEDNINVKGLIITNPSNPLGTTIDKETLKGLVSFINEKKIHFVCDEIFAGTVFDAPKFVSVSEVIEEADMKCINRNLIHVVYSLSKDMGLPGFRVGIVYSYNDGVVCCSRKMSSFGLVSSHTQQLVASMLSDRKFVDKFLAESSKRLANRRKVFTRELELVGINCLKGNAGLFVWMDLRPLLKQDTFEAEMLLWKVIVNDVKLNVSPGSSFHCSEPGWFRVCFANMDDETLVVALRRITTLVAPVKNNKRWQNTTLRLSFSPRRFDDSVNSPHMTLGSPHSPLVQATT